MTMAVARAPAIVAWLLGHAQSPGAGHAATVWTDSVRHGRSSRTRPLTTSLSTYAVTVATAIVILAPVWWRLAVPLTLAVGASRVLTGAHYWHDVLAGLAVGVFIVWFGTWALAPAAHRLLQRSVDAGPPQWRRVVGQGYVPRYAAADVPGTGADHDAEPLERPGESDED